MLSLYASANPGSQAESESGRARSTSSDALHQEVSRGEGINTDAEADMLLAEASSAICVQRFDGSRNSAIHTTYRISLRSSSLREPRYPLLRVVLVRTVSSKPAVDLALDGLVWCMVG